ncbi:MAG: SGNH/GDSL hydrolase family protein, partial [Terrimicrobiaceae bacterium]|nr:SGNH/GDSL hydrolase family protein [Terrimicrobiaceae bacterium]
FVILGDSISAGASATAREALPPYSPTWAELFADKVRHGSSAPVRLKNYSLGGMDSAWGRTYAPFFFRTSPPDLLIAGFGMNDRRRYTPDQFQENIASIIAAARAANPLCAVILISSMRNNPLCGDQEHLDQFRQALKSLEKDGIRVADMTAVTDRLLQRKTYFDLTGNGVNHPNDYLIRWYAETIFNAFNH